MRPLRVLSLFDGISCGQVALQRVGIPIEVYYASEIKKHAIQVTQEHYPSTIQLGDVRNIKGSDLPKIDLLIGGSPCQDFSNACNHIRKAQGLEGKKSNLFFEYLRLLDELKPIYFLLENVYMEYSQYWKVTELLNVEPVRINSSLAHLL